MCGSELTSAMPYFQSISQQKLRRFCNMLQMLPLVNNIAKHPSVACCVHNSVSISAELMSFLNWQELVVSW